MVIENSEFASSDEDDEDDHEILTPGRIRIAWHPNGEEEVVKEKHVGLADRSLMPGDVVRRLIVGKDTQRGSKTFFIYIYNCSSLYENP